MYYMSLYVLSGRGGCLNNVIKPIQPNDPVSQPSCATQLADPANQGDSANYYKLQLIKWVTWSSQLIQLTNKSGNSVAQSSYSSQANQWADTVDPDRQRASVYANHVRFITEYCYCTIYSPAVFPIALSGIIVQPDSQFQIFEGSYSQFQIFLEANFSLPDLFMNSRYSRFQSF